MHNNFFNNFHIDADYVSLPLEQNQLRDFLDKKAYDGFNVTIPHKETVARILDLQKQLTSVAKAIMAVNTVKLEGDHYLGTNTDAPGFSLMLNEELKLSLKGLTILLLGAGGAAKAIAYEALGAAKVYVYDNDVEKAYALTRHYAAWSQNFQVISSIDRFSEILFTVDLVVNATPIGMEATKAESILSKQQLALLRPEAVVVDIIYAPLKTTLLKLAEKRRLRTLNGVGMLAGQGILAQRFWFGRSMGYAEAKKVILKAL